MEGAPCPSAISFYQTIDNPESGQRPITEVSSDLLLPAGPRKVGQSLPVFRVRRSETCLDGSSAWRKPNEPMHWIVAIAKRIVKKAVMSWNPGMATNRRLLVTDKLFSAILDKSIRAQAFLQKIANNKTQKTNNNQIVSSWKKLTVISVFSFIFFTIRDPLCCITILWCLIVEACM